MEPPRVGRVFRSSGVETVEFRAGVVIGAGSLSFRLLQTLTDRPPVVVRHRWLTTPTQPIAVDDILAYLLAARELPAGESRVVEVGGADVVSYADPIREYARQTGRRRLVFVPVLTPYLSGLWLALVTPPDFEVGRPLIEGLKNATAVRDTTGREVFPVRPVGVREGPSGGPPPTQRGDSPPARSQPCKTTAAWEWVAMMRTE